MPPNLQLVSPVAQGSGLAAAGAGVLDNFTQTLGRIADLNFQQKRLEQQAQAEQEQRLAIEAYKNYQAKQQGEQFLQLIGKNPNDLQTVMEAAAATGFLTPSLIGARFNVDKSNSLNVLRGAQTDKVKAETEQIKKGKGKGGAKDQFLQINTQLNQLVTKKDQLSKRLVDPFSGLDDKAKQNLSMEIRDLTKRQIELTNRYNDLATDPSAQIELAPYVQQTLPESVTPPQPEQPGFFNRLGSSISGMFGVE